MRRRDFTMGLLLGSAPQSLRAEQGEKQRLIAIVITAGPVLAPSS